MTNAKSWRGGAVTAVVVAAFIGVLLLAGQSYQRKQEQREVMGAIMTDLASGKTIAGTLTADYLTACIDSHDAFNAAHGAFDTGVAGAQSEITADLVNKGRCVITGQSVRFSMTADGRARFATPHGVADLWLASRH